ncbi:FG-GAP-like repeat-containing protein [Streptomyces sp. SID12501]|uniref:FlgD/Vpr Ig-like domain-containing protein n=1 Tax=Streptomyces sp. SID12501 TaxID=2706042 RepID=A0A6B3C8A4_9ACTN|nr:FG-GAP-like repeat-containing protein [Streptomyces sp. SID12501]NEC92612.1 hypothetical protein [Streptomyces sp. SID12501]
MRRTILRTAPRGKRSRAGAVPVAAALALVAGLLQFASGPAVAADDGDMPSVTLTGEHRVVPRQVNLVAVDDSGYLSVNELNNGASPATWTGRDGSTREFRRYGTTNAYNGGLGLERAAGTTNLYQIRRYATNQVTRFYVPAGDRATRIFAENRLVVARKVDEKWTLRLLEMPAGGGKLIDRPVTGVADDFSGTMLEEASDTRGAAFWYKQAGGANPWRTALLDFATAAVTYVPSDDFGLLERPHLAGDTVLFYAIDKAWQNSRLYVIDRSRPQAPGHVIDLPRSVLLKARAIGDWLMYPDEDSKNAIRAVPVTGGPARTLLPASSGSFVDGDDGSFSIAGGTDAEHWAIQHVTLGADGVPAFEPVAPLPAVSVYEAGGIAVDQGRVLLGTEHANAPGLYDGTDLTGTDISQAADGTLTAAPRENMGDLGYEVHNPDYSYWATCYGLCLRFTGTGEGTLPPPGDGVSGDVLAASGSYMVITRGQGKLQVRDGSKVLATGSWPAAALWGNTLWVATAPQGATVYERYSLPSMRKLESVAIASCLPTDLQVVNRYLYWSCGPDDEAGVYDLDRQSQQEVPQGYARLGDGYLVSQDDDAGKLLITYLKGAVPADRAGTEELGPLPSPPYAPADRRGRFWNVDRFGGPVAYQTASGDVTVKWPQVTNSPLTATHSTVPTSVDLRKGGFGGTWYMNRPTASWKLTVTTPSGAVVRTVTGGPAHGELTAGWDGRTENGALVRTGSYRVSLTARAANGATTDTPIYDGPLTVRSLERHDFGRDGIGDLITFDSAGRLAIQPGTGRGTIDSAHRTLAGGWPTSSTLVPFGDLSGDVCNDLLVRDSAGRLTRYDGTCGKAFTPRTTHRLLGTGFGGYNALTSPGDLTGDGLADLVARDKAGVLWRYSADGKGGLTDRVRLAAGQGGYTRLVGAGDLNADGIGDMVGLDGRGALWRWLGDGKGGFGARVRIAQGISVNALAVPGDLTGDGRPDLVGRDSAGALWRWNGTSAATFGTKTRIATGWNGYTGLY